MIVYVTFKMYNEYFLCYLVKVTFLCISCCRWNWLSCVI